MLHLLYTMYSLDRRKLATHVYSVLNSLRKTANILNVSHSSVARWIVHPEKKQYDSSKRKLHGKTTQVIVGILAAVMSDPLISTRELARLISSSIGVNISRELARCVLRNNGLTRKKARFYGEPADLKEKTENFLAMRDVYVQEGRTFFSLDEVSFGRHGAPVYGYSPRGSALRIRKKAARVTTISALVISDSNGNMVKDCKNGSFSTESFVSFLTRLDIPAKSVILLDNVAFHRSRRALEVVTMRGWDLLFVPPYSPWFNPIEGIFSIIKRVWYAQASIDNAFYRVTSAHANAFFKQSLELRGQPV